MGLLVFRRINGAGKLANLARDYFAIFFTSFTV